MAVKNIVAGNYSITPSSDGRRHSAYPSGNAPSGGNAALSWVAPEGIAVGKLLMLMSDGTHNLVVPSNERFTGFSQSSAASGSNVELADTQFTGLKGTPKYSDVARGQGRSWDAFQLDNGSYSASGGGVTVFSELSTEAFLSYAVRVPATSVIPENHEGTWGAGEFPNGSLWKVAWLLNFQMDGADTDVCIPTFIPAAKFAGNGITYPPLRDVSRNGIGNEPDWWKWDTWIRVSAWLRAGADPDVDGCNMWFEVCNTVDTSSTHSYAYSGSTPLFASADAPPHVWGGINIPGWSDVAATKQADFLYTDVSIRWGQRSAARLEVGNAPTYGACTDKAICPAVKRYSGRGVEYKIERGGISLSGDSWLYYTDADNVTTLVGKFT